MGRLTAFRDYVASKVADLSISRRWYSNGDKRFQRREYRSYEQYLSHQRSKLSRIDLRDYDRHYREVLRERLESSGAIKPGMSALCLAARIGTEVKALIDLGCFAVGIDLNPGPGNRFVLHGDFHNLQFATSTADIVFTNSLDHVFDLDKVLEETTRVLAPDGILIVEAVRGSREGAQPMFYESYAWSTIDSLIEQIERGGFQLASRQAFETPWHGEHLHFHRNASSSARFQ